MPINRRNDTLLARLDDPTPAVALLVTAGLVLLTFAHVAVGRALGDPQPGPYLHDEFSYRLQSVMLAHGRLWATPPTDLPHFAALFDSFHLLVEPVYGSIYWPGTALLSAPGAWLGLPVWVTPVLVVAATVAAVYHAARRLVGGVWALTAAALALGVLDSELFALRLLSHAPAALAGALLLLTWLGWREAATSRRRAAWAVAAGAAAGLLAVTRPADAVAFALPVAAGVAIDLARQPAGMKTRRALAVLACAAAGALPFAALQLTLDYGTTGSFLLPPYVQYQRVNQPGILYGDAAAAVPDLPADAPPEKRELYESWLRPSLQTYARRGATRQTLQTRLPAALRVMSLKVVLLPVIALGLLALLGLVPTSRPTPLVVGAVVAAVPVAFLLVYAPNPIFQPIYAKPLVVPAALALAAGCRAVADWCRPPIARRWVTTALLAVAGGVIIYTAVTPGRIKQDLGEIRNRERLSRELAADGRRALIFVPHAPGRPLSELVYNENVVLPDAAAVIWARDLGPERDAATLDYYRRRQPDRRAFRLSRETGRARPLAEDQ